MARRAWLGGIATTSCLLFVIALTGSTAVAQAGVPLPAPVIAPVVAPTDDPLAVTAIYRDPAVAPAEPVFIVQLATPLSELADGTRVSLLTGEPWGIQRRASLILEGGAARGDVEENTAGSFEFVQPADVSITDEGWARIRLDPMDDSDLLWAETGAVDGATVLSTVFPFRQVSGASGPGTLAATLAATVFDAANVPTGEIVPLDGVPTLEVVNQAITVRTTQPVPTEVDGLPVTRVRDFLRIVPDFSDGGRAPYFVVIDHTDRTVTYLDNTAGIPVEVEAPESSWLVDGLEDTETETATVTFDRAGLLAAVGLTADESTAVGVARAVVLEDETYVTADGPVGALTWFDESLGGSSPPSSTATTAPEVEPTTIAAAPASDDSGPNPAVLIAAVVVAVGLGGAALISARRNRRALAEPDVALGAMAKVVESTSHGDDDHEDPEPAPVPTRHPGRTSLRVPGSGGRPPSDPSGAVGVAGARAVVSREAQARAAAERAIAEENAEREAAESTEDGREALYAAMRRKAAEAGEGHEDGDGGEVVAEPSALAQPSAPAEPPASEEPPASAEPALPKSTRPDDALHALNRLIDDLPLPDDRS